MTKEDMKDRISQACSEITIEQLIKAFCQTFQRRLRLCLQEGKHFEHLLN